MREQTFIDILHRVHQTTQQENWDFIPDYRIVRYEVEHPEILPDIRAVNDLRDTTFKAEISKAGGRVTHTIGLRELEYVFDKHEECDLPDLVRTGIISHLADDAQTRQYVARMKINFSVDEKTLCAVRTGKGVLFFDVSGWGLQCKQAYLQYLADNFYNSTGREHGYAHEYWIYDAPEELLDMKEQSAHAFSVYNFSFLPHKAHYHDPSLVEGFRVYRSCSMNPDYDAFHRFSQTFNTTTSVNNVQIQRLLYMRSVGHMYPGLDNRRIPLLSEMEFSPYNRQLEILSQDTEHNKQDIYKVQHIISDLAAEILQKRFHIAPSQVYLSRKARWETEQRNPGDSEKSETTRAAKPKIR